QRLHRALHLTTLRRRHLIVFDDDRALPVRRPQLGDALAHNARGLPHLLHADQIAVVAVAILADRDVEIHFRIALVGLRLAQIPRRARTAHHRAGEAPL